MAQGYKDFTAGAVLTAADLEDYNQNQSIMRFASAAARDTAVATVKTEGMMAYLIDVNTVTVYNGSAWSTVGPVHGAMLAWPSPGIAQGVGVTFTTTTATYSRIGRRIFFEAVLVITGAGTASNLITLSLPVTALSSNTNSVIGTGYIYDNSAASKYPCIAVIATTATMKFTDLSINLQYIGLTGFTAGFAVNDILTVSGNYEAAADA